MSSTEKATLSRLGEYILVRLLCKHDGYSARQITDALKALLKERGSAADQLRLVEAELTALTRAGFVKGVRKASFISTAGGWRAAAGALDWKEPPPTPVWKDLQKRLHTCIGQRNARTLASSFQLVVGAAPTIEKVRDALAWHAIGVKRSDPFTADAAIQVLLNRLAGTSTLLSFEQVIEKLVANAAAPAPSTPPATPEDMLPEDDAAFAARVLAAARASKTGRFGDDKVFISHVLRQLAEEGAAVDDAEAFKVRLVSAHRRGLLSLNRADLVEAMDPADVSASETRYLSTTFHFVRI